MELTIYSFSTYLPSWSDRAPMLHSAHRAHRRFMGAYCPQLVGTCCYVLVLFPKRPRHPRLVEKMDYPSADLSIRHRSR